MRVAMRAYYVYGVMPSYDMRTAMRGYYVRVRVSFVA